MSGHAGHYSLIQYCPDPSRAEAANVGVLLFCPALRFIDARTASGNDRIRRFFRGRDLDLARVNMMKRSIERRLKVDSSRFNALEDLHNFIESRANDMILTPPRAVKVTDPQNDLKKLFDELVGGRVREDAHEVLLPELEEPFARLQQAGRLWTRQKVKVPLLGTTLRVPYAYRNGAVNLIKPQRFPSPEDEARRTAGHLAIEGDLLQRHPQEAGEQFRLVIVSAGRSEAVVGREDMVAPLFKEYNVRFVRRAEVREFVTQVEREAHHA